MPKPFTFWTAIEILFNLGTIAYWLYLLWQVDRNTRWAILFTWFVVNMRFRSMHERILSAEIEAHKRNYSF